MSSLLRPLAGLAAIAIAAGTGAPAYASLNDQFPCKSEDHASLLVYISAFDNNKAVLQAVGKNGGEADIHELRLKHGGSWQDFRYEDRQHHVFVGGNGKAVLLMHGKAYFCEYVGPSEEEVADAQASRVLLGANGLDIVAQGVSLPDGLGFGEKENTVVMQLSHVLGAPGEKMTNDECGAGPMNFRRFGPLTVNFQRGEWVGWLLDRGSGREGGPVPVTLEDGITVGSPAGELAGQGDYFEESTLGDEFMVEGISGLSSGRGSDAKIDTLWAGTNCNFR